MLPTAHYSWSEISWNKWTSRNLWWLWHYIIYEILYLNLRHKVKVRRSRTPFHCRMNEKFNFVKLKSVKEGESENITKIIWKLSPQLITEVPRIQDNSWVLEIISGWQDEIHHSCLPLSIFSGYYFLTYYRLQFLSLNISAKVFCFIKSNFIKVLILTILQVSWTESSNRK